MKKTAFLLICLLWVVCAYAEEPKGPFEVWIERYLSQGDSSNVYYKPMTNRFKLRPDVYLRPFKVVVKNVSKDTQTLAVDLSQGPLTYISFEVSDENGNENLITKKIDINKSQLSNYQYIGPGRSKEFEVLITQKEWDNAFALAGKGSRKFKVRALYKSGSKTFYSDYYYIEFEE